MLMKVKDTINTFSDGTVNLYADRSEVKPKAVKKNKKDVKTLESLFVQTSAVTADETKKIADHFINQNFFNSFIGTVIVINAIMIGVETDIGRGDDLNDRVVFFLFELGFGTVFVTEMILRIRLLKWDYFLEPWNVLDYNLVVFSFADIMLSVIFPDSGDMKMLNAFRVIRMVRMIRNVRLLRMFRDLWFLVIGFFQTLSTLYWVGLLTGIILYVFSLFTTIFIGESEQALKDWPEGAIYFGKTYRGIFTGFQIITFESWSPIVRSAGMLSKAWYVGFLAIIVLCSFGILNVIVAVIVERTLTIALINEEERIVVIDEFEKKIIKIMANLFKKMNPNGGHELNLAQFVELIETKEFTSYLKLIDVPSTEAEELFELMDVDLSNCLSPGEFMTGMRRLKGLAKGKDMVQLISYVQRAMNKALNLHERIERVIDSIDIILERLDDLWGITEADIFDRQLQAERMKKLKVKVGKRKEIIGTFDKNNKEWYNKFLY